MEEFEITMEINKVSWHLDLLKQAIKKVDERYIRSADLEYHPENEAYISLAERVFAYELYRQWANILEPYKTGLVLNGETRKDFVGHFIEKFNETKGKNNDSAFFYPDIVLHDENVVESRCNMIVCEIKRYENIDGTIDDLNKLDLFLSEELKPKMVGKEWNSYHYAVFLLIGPQMDKDNHPINLLRDLEKKIRRSQLNIEPSKQNRIICITYNGNESDLNSTTLAELLIEQ